MKNILPKENGLAVLTLLLIVALIIAAGATGAYIATKKPQLLQQVSKSISTSEEGTPAGETKSANPTETNAPTSSQDNDDTKDSASLNSTETKDWEKLGIDSTWNLYRMTYLGFEVSMPRQMYNPHYGCSYNTDGGDHSYRPKGGMDDVLLLNTKKSAVFINNSFTQLTEETADENGIHYYGGCEKVIVGFNNIGDYGTHFWQFLTETVENDSDLLKFVQGNYGAGCEISKKPSSTQTGTYDVFVESGGMEDESCPVNFMYTIKYSPTKNEAVSWNRGQACTFAANADYVCYDDAVNSSFRFLE